MAPVDLGGDGVLHRCSSGGIAEYGKPEIFNSDQGAQFTSSAFTGLLRGHGIRISMDGKSCWRDIVFMERVWRSIKYEEI